MIAASLMMTARADGASPLKMDAAFAHAAAFGGKIAPMIGIADSSTIRHRILCRPACHEATVYAVSASAIPIARMVPVVSSMENLFASVIVKQMKTVRRNITVKNSKATCPAFQKRVPAHVMQPRPVS